MPLRVSRPVTMAQMDRVLAFYGHPASAFSNSLGFDTTVLLDETHNGARAVTLMLSGSAKTHVQFWARPEAVPDGPAFPSLDMFARSAGSNQVNYGQPEDAQAFCRVGTWTVDRYTQYISRVHELVMTPPPSNVATSTPPSGKPFDVFIDDHISWDCTSPACNLADAAKAVYGLGHRMTWVPFNFANGWFPYTYDPAGYGFELHWFFTPADFRPSGQLYPGCFSTWTDNGTCPGAFAPSDTPPTPGTPSGTPSSRGDANNRRILIALLILSSVSVTLLIILIWLMPAVRGSQLKPLLVERSSMALTYQLSGVMPSKKA